MRSQFFWRKIAQSVTKREAERCARLYHQPAAAPRVFPDIEQAPRKYIQKQEVEDRRLDQLEMFKDK
jgi:hypothetical protein